MLKDLGLCLNDQAFTTIVRHIYDASTRAMHLLNSPEQVLYLHQPAQFTNQGITPSITMQFTKAILLLGLAVTGLATPVDEEGKTTQSHLSYINDQTSSSDPLQLTCPIC